MKRLWEWFCEWMDLENAVLFAGLGLVWYGARFRDWGAVFVGLYLLLSLRPLRKLL